MTYPVFLYNMLLAATYVVLAVVFFWLHRSRSSRLAWWLMILFACSFVDNGTYFMKEVFTALGHPDPLFATFYQAAEALFIACYPFIIRMISGCFYDDMPSKRSMVVLARLAPSRRRSASPRPSCLTRCSARCTPFCTRGCSCG